MFGGDEVCGERAAWEGSWSSVEVLMEEDVLSYMRCEIVDIKERFVLIV